MVPVPAPARAAAAGRRPESRSRRCERQRDPDVHDRRRPGLHQLHPDLRRRGRRPAGRQFAGSPARSWRPPTAQLLELRGDEALSVFDSARDAIGAASALQERFVTEAVRDADMPLLVGIGIDVGEAVPVEGGYRGGALNLAARLCSLAAPGEILASRSPPTWPDR